jgi:hypothetical protein
VIANSRKAIVNNSVTLLIVLQSKLLREFDAGEKFVGCHTTRTLWTIQVSITFDLSAAAGIGQQSRVRLAENPVHHSSKNLKNLQFHLSGRLGHPLQSESQKK